MTKERIFVIAEAGVNHNGSVERALEMVDAAAAAGADAVKFQTFRAEAVVSATAVMAPYQQRNTGRQQSQLEMVKALELPFAAHHALAARCREKRVEFMSTAFDEESLRFLVDEIRIKRVKVPSGDIDHAPLLLQAAASGLPLIVSTGMSVLRDVEIAMGTIAYAYCGPRDAVPSVAAFDKALKSGKAREALKDRVTLLHCVTEYPAPIASVNLKAMDTLSDTFGVRVGYSDHTIGISAAIAAAARGAKIIEKHFTLDRSLPGPDHRCSLEPTELAVMVNGIRDTESALGDGTKVPAPIEGANRAVARRSLVATRSIRAGERFSSENVGIKRPGTGVSPLLYWEYLGQLACHDYQADELIKPLGSKRG